MRSSKSFSKVQLIFVSFFFLTFTACKVSYIPSMHNVPSLKQKNDVQLSASLSNFQGAYAVTDNVGLILDAQISGFGKSSGTDVTYTKRRQFIEGGAGYFKQMDDNNIFQCFGGAGYGIVSFDNVYSSYTEHYKASATKIFIQPSFGYSDKNFDVAFAVKAMSMKFFGVDTTNYSVYSLKSDDLYNIDKHPYIFLEPSLTARAGSENAKVFLQLLYSNKMNAEPIRYYSLNFYLGISFRF